MACPGDGWLGQRSFDVPESLTSRNKARTVAYDNLDRVTTLTHQTGTGTNLASYGYAFDAAGRLTRETNAEGTATFTYDNTDQLTGADRPVGQSDEAYSYDRNGNRTMTGYTTTTGNRVSASPGYTYAYDFEGNLSSKTETASGKVTTYSYDHRNRLTGVTQRASSGGAIVAQATYVYDAFDRRIKTETDADGAGGGAPAVNWTVYDGENPYADFNSGGALQTRYLHGPAVDWLLARTSASGTSAWYLTDRLGSVRDIANTSGAVIDHIAYDAYGKITSESSPANGDRFKFTGREYDPVTGLQYNRARYYDATIGRWTQEDPIGFAAGDANLYRYVGNGPTNYRDPTGLDRLKAEEMLGQPGRWNLYVEEDSLFSGTVIHNWVGTLDRSGLVTFCVNGREIKVKLGTLVRAAWDGKLRTGVARWFEKNALDDQGEWEARNGYRAMLAREGADSGYFANSLSANEQMKWLSEQGILWFAMGAFRNYPRTRLARSHLTYEHVGTREWHRPTGGGPGS